MPNPQWGGGLSVGGGERACLWWGYFFVGRFSCELIGGTRRTIARYETRFSASLEFGGNFGVPHQFAINN